MSVQVLSVSSKGQIALPVGLRKQLSISSGTKLAAYVSDDMIMLKVVKLPSVEDFRKSLDEAKMWAKEAGLREEDVADIIKTARIEKRK